MNDFAPNALCFIFGISSVEQMLFEHIFSHIGSLMVKSSCMHFGDTLLMHLSVSSPIL